MFAKVIAHSRPADGGKDLLTMQLKYWLPIHAEARTHRVISVNGVEYVEFTQDESFMSDPNLSRNAASNRAIPVNKVIEQVENDPAGPIFFGKNQPGMQAAEEVDDVPLAKRLWADAARDAVKHARLMTEMGWHKQTANRVLMPYQWMHVIVTATDWDNFFELRDHADAQPEIRALAQLMRKAMEASDPRILKPGQWHLPYVSDEEYWGGIDIGTLKGISTARNARVSYLTHAGEKPSVEKDMGLYDMLVGSRPLHASPAEHVATPDYKLPNGEWANPHLHGNLEGWIQHRKELEVIHWSK